MNQHFLIIKLAIYLCLSLVPFKGNCCSAYKYSNKNKVFVAKNFDWYTGQGYLIKNNRHQNKCTYLEYKKKNTCWTSKYGSITFNQNGKEFPYGGINEKGLVVEMLWLKETNYTENLANTTTISELEWIQYQLDNYTLVDEVIQNIGELTIDPITSTIHYFITDPTGKSTILEFINGELIIIESSDNIQTITNSTYRLNNTTYEKYKSKFGQKYIPKFKRSSLRYCSIQNNLTKWQAKDSFNSMAAFDILSNVSEDKEVYKTYWGIVYDLTDLKINFKTYLNTQIKYLDLADLNFQSETTEYYDLLSENLDPQVSLTAYSSEINAKLIEDCIKPTLLLNYDLLNKHQINPQKSNLDQVFTQNHMDVIVQIITKKTSGTVKYFLANSELQYKRQGPYGGSVPINSEITYHKLYSLPTKSKYAFGAMHDINSNGYLDRNFLKMPKEPFSFSGKNLANNLLVEEIKQNAH